MSEATVRRDRDARASVVVLVLFLAVAGASLAAVLIVNEEPTLGGLATATAAITMLLGASWAWDTGAPRLLFADSAAERVVDALLLGAVAWAALPEEPRLGAAALVAMVASYLASYLRARAAGLGFRVEESMAERGSRTGLFALGLVLGWVEAGVWAWAALSCVAAVRRTRGVAGQQGNT